MKNTKKTIPRGRATAEELWEMDLKKKTYIFPLDVAKAIENQSTEEGRSETDIMLDAFRAYKKEFESFARPMKEQKKK